LKKTNVNIDAMANALKISPMLATVLAHRGINTKSAAYRFFYPGKDQLNDPASLKDIGKAVPLLKAAVENKVKIVIYGDYDVDGVMSTAILYKALKSRGADVISYIPHREEEGYGMNIGAVEKLRAQGVGLILTCDNGIAALAEIKHAKALGMNVIVLDHHEPAFEEDKAGRRKDILPEADAVIDAKRGDCAYPFKQLCAAGLSFQFVRYFYAQIGAAFADEDEYLILAAIATVCDVVDLVDENRALVKLGLDLINGKKNKNIGLAALLKERKLTDKRIGTFELGYVIGPCINASGRIETATTAARLFIAEDEGDAAILAKKLSELNDDRKALTAQSVESIMAELRGKPLDKVLVLYSPEIHESIAGIVAGRIKDAFYHPAIVLTDSQAIAKGSGRSIEGYHLFEELFRHSDLFERFGGHEMAAGLSMKHENIDALRERLNANCQLTDSDFEQTIRIDKEISLTEVTFERARELTVLEPFGRMNKEPVFGTKNIVADLIETIGADGQTLRFTFTTVTATAETGRTIKAVCFHKLDQFKEQLGATFGEKALEKFQYGRIMNIRLDVLYCIEINDYNNNTYVNMKIIDFRLVL
ncbi:MAG: single-stranded-DNA-specific exonuclease RecJ, partial [Clostridiales bacterium]|nr:single-stranded-DNA-specific exonuclease RecJ [Clostridiales bacterium]